MDNFNKRYEASVSSVAKGLAQAESQLKTRKDLCYRTLSYLADLPEELGLLDFDLFGSMLTVRFKHFKAQVLSDLQSIVGGAIEADPDNSHKFEVGQAHLLWVCLKFYPDPLSENQLNFNFNNEE